MKERGHARRQAGQIIIILLLGMLVALTIGLAIVQNSSTDLSLSTKTEQSSRAFSAAEAGIEYALLPGSTDTTINLVNEAKSEVDVSSLLPISTSPQAIEYPPISRSKVAQFWLADPNSSGNANVPTRFYTLNNVLIYFGSCGANGCPIDPNDKPAIEATVVYWDDDFSSYGMKRSFIDSDASRAAGDPDWEVPGVGTLTGECDSLGLSPNTEVETTTSTPAKSRFYCYVRFVMNPSGISFRPPALDNPILIRIRLLYSQSPHKIAIASENPAAVSPQNGKFPPQVTIVTSKGTSGETERVLKGFKTIKLIPNLFDYAVFSVPSITK